jgi:hypothetical protein
MGTNAFAIPGQGRSIGQQEFEVGLQSGVNFDLSVSNATVIKAQQMQRESSNSTQADDRPITGTATG